MSAPRPADQVPYGDPPRRPATIAQATSVQAGAERAHGEDPDSAEDQLQSLRTRAIASAAVIVVSGATAAVLAVLRPELAVAVTLTALAAGVAALIVSGSMAARQVRAAIDDAARSRRDADAAAAELAAHECPDIVDTHRAAQPARRYAGAPAAAMLADPAVSGARDRTRDGVRDGDADGHPAGILGHFPGRAEVIARYARRLQGLLNMCLQRLDGVENKHEDPELLAALYEIDHGVVQARRQAANLAILAGELPQRRSANPVRLYSVLRSALQEIPRYTQAAILPAPKVLLDGSGVVEIIHLLAELLDNATSVSDPAGDPVSVQTRVLPSGSLCVKVVDNGLGLSDDHIDRANHVLDCSDPDEADQLLKSHRTGLVVVAQLARRNNIKVVLERNVYEGVTAVVIFPPTMLVAEQAADEPPAVRGQRAMPALTRGAERTSASLPAIDATSGQERAAQDRSAPTRTSGDRPAPVAAAAAPAVTSVPQRKAGAETYAPDRPSPQSADTYGTNDHPDGTINGHTGSVVHHHRTSGGLSPVEQPDRQQGLSGLPMRTRRAAANEPVDDNRPPLPVRSRTASLMPEELRTPPTGPVMTPGHSAALLAGFQEVREARRDGQPQTDDQPQSTQRTGKSWPTS